jgi:hypothetical protein
MSEEIKIEQAQQVTQESKEAPLSIIERAEAANKVLEANIKRQEEILKKQEEVAAKQLLGGRAIAGISKTKQEEAAEELDKRVQEALRKFR